MIDEKDLKTEVVPDGIPGAMRAGTASHVRVTHLPTGLVAECGNERSQLLCKATAVEELTRKLGLR